MILVDTSIWVDHFRSVNARLFDLLNNGEVLVHPFILGELALGNLRNRAQILDLLCKLPELPVAEHNEVLALVDNRRLYGGGIGWVDAHLMASALLARVTLLTNDKALQRATRIAGVFTS